MLSSTLESPLAELETDVFRTQPGLLGLAKGRDTTWRSVFFRPSPGFCADGHQA
jgi:hypothetical protein